MFPSAPVVGTPMPAVHASQEVRDFIALRRSANKAMMTEPGPDPKRLGHIITAATRVPDHRRMTPWRFIVIEGDARVAFGQKAAEVQRSEDPETTENALEATRNLLLRAPTIIAVISSPTDDGRTPVWEQELSAGALCFNLLLAANAAGWAGVWLTEWIAFSEGVNHVLGLEGEERIAGYVYLGTPSADPQERARPDSAPLITQWES
jgi:nitroreductase